MSIYFVSPNDFIGLIQQYFPCKISKRALTFYAIKPLTQDMQFTLNMLNAPYIVEEDDPDDNSGCNNLHSLGDIMLLWKKIDTKKINAEIAIFNARQKEVLEPKHIEPL